MIKVKTFCDYKHDRMAREINIFLCDIGSRPEYKFIDAKYQTSIDSDDDICFSALVIYEDNSID